MQRRIVLMMLGLLLARCDKEHTIDLLPGPLAQTRPDAGQEGGSTRGGCSADSDCPGAQPHCETLTKSCVECLANQDCSTGTCDSMMHTCTGCATNADCNTSAPICDFDVHSCVQCESSGQCPPGQVCAFESHRCAPACQTNADCAGSGRPYCAIASRVCVECTTDSDCASARKPPRCNLLNGTCVECLTDGDCSAGHCQVFEHLCVECLTNADCDGRVCDQYRCGT